jgi:hypothetical protein
MIHRYLPLAAVLALFALACGWRPWLHRRRYGEWGIVLFRTGRASQDVRDALLVVAFVLLFVQAAVAAAWPGAARTSHGTLAWMGAAAMAAGIALLLVAQLQMGASWRIGIDPVARPGLVSHGLYRHSRNPIYVALLAGIVGYAVLLPTVLSAAVLVASLAGVLRQVRAEEAYLSDAYGNAFGEYARRVPRFLPAVVLVAMTALAAALALSYAYRAATIGTAYAAKIVCSGVFVSRRDAAAVFMNDVAMDDLAAMRVFDVRTDRERSAVTVSLFGRAARTAVFREGLGCALDFGDVARAAVPAPVPAEPLETRIDPRFDAVLDWAFAEPDPSRPRRTRAVVVLHGGRVVAERYAPGFTRETPLAGWSMAKSVTGALAGILVKEGRMARDDPPPVPEWQHAGDARKRITLDHLLRMSSGLAFDEDYTDPLADVMRMLFAEPSAGAYAAAQPLDHAPGTRWEYSSGTTNVITHSMRQVLGADYAASPRRALFDRIGMSSAVMEADASGTFVGSSFMYATARDWARFGLLYLRDGAWGGERILPEGWVAYSRTPAPTAPGGIYGAHFWLRLHAGASCSRGEPPPPDAFHASGHEGQHLTIIPSRDLVVVRLGMTRYPCAWDQREFITRVLDVKPGSEV